MAKILKERNDGTTTEVKVIYITSSMRAASDRFKAMRQNNKSKHPGTFVIEGPDSFSYTEGVTKYTYTLMMK